MSSDEYLDITELAVRFRVRERVITHYVETGAIPYRKIGKAVRFRWSDVQAWFDALPGANPLKEFSAQFPAPSSEKSGNKGSPDDTARPPILLRRGARRRHSLEGSGEGSR